MNFYESTEKWVLESSDQELTEFFAAFNKDEKEDHRDIIHLINYFITKKYPDNWVEKYFEFRGLIAKATDAGELDGVIDKIIADNQQVSDDLKAGKLAALGRLIGLVRKALPSSNPSDAKKALELRFNLKVSV